MKKSILLVFLFFIIQSSFGQSNSNITQIEFSYYFFDNKVFQFDKNENGEQFENGDGYRVGIQYSKKITSNIWIGSGINYLRATNGYYGPAIDTTYGNIIYTVGSRIIQVPAKVRFDLIKWFYVRTGLSLDYQINNRNGNYIHNQSGMSYSLSCGIDLKIKDQIRLQIEPEVGMTSLIALYPKDYQQHFTLSGINIIIGFRF